jgi:hypothetical protein
VGEGPSTIIVEVQPRAPHHHLHHFEVHAPPPEDILAKLIITYTLKGKLTTWLCLVEGYLASLHDLVSLKIENTICSRVRCINKENIIDRPSLKLIQLLPFPQNKTLAIKDMEVTHLGCATEHQLVAGFLLIHSEVDPVPHIARGIHHVSPKHRP